MAKIAEWPKDAAFVLSRPQEGVPAPREASGGAGPPSPPAAPPPPVKRLKVTFSAGDRRDPTSLAAVYGNGEVIGRAESLHERAAAKKEELDAAVPSLSWAKPDHPGRGNAPESADLHHPARDGSSQLSMYPAGGFAQQPMAGAVDDGEGRRSLSQGRDLPSSPQQHPENLVPPHHCATTGLRQSLGAHVAGQERPRDRPESPLRDLDSIELGRHAAAVREAFVQPSEHGQHSAPPSPLRAFASLDLPTEELDDALQLQLLTPTLANGVCTPMLHQACSWLPTPVHCKHWLRLAKVETPVSNGIGVSRPGCVLHPPSMTSALHAV